MYNNIGQKLKGLAIFVFIVETLCAVIAGIAFLADEIILVGLLVLIGGPIVAWLSSWVLYGIGEAVEYAKSANNYTNKIFEKLNEEYTQPPKKPTQTNIPVKAPEPVKNTTQDTETKATFSVTDTGKIICSQCKFEQPVGRKVCWHCGAKFEEI